MDYRIQGTILPVLVTNHTVTIAAELVCRGCLHYFISTVKYPIINVVPHQKNHKVIIGQCNISHPVPSSTSDAANLSVLEGLEDDHEDLSPQNVEFHKDVQSTLESKLEAPIERVFYINAYGQEIYPSPNPEFLQNLGRRKALVYSCGSLWTRRVPHFSHLGHELTRIGWVASFRASP